MAKLLLYILCQVSLVFGFYHSCTQCNDGEDQPNDLCKCDGDCFLFGDCCNSTFDLSTCESDTVVSPGVEFVCRSIFIDSQIQPLLNEAYWMVSSCPDSWSTEMVIQAVIRENCTSLSSSLPPVTDLDTGIVYANEFCALCNRIENQLAWQPNLVCPSKLKEALRFSNIQEVLAEYPDIFKTQCQACSFQVPSNSVPVSARPCVFTISSCASKSDLEDFSRISYTEDEYTALVNDCVNLPMDIVVVPDSLITLYDYRNNFQPSKLFKNEACAKCNGADMFSIQQIVELTKRENFPYQCALINSPAIPPLPKAIDRQKESVIDDIRNILSVPECISDIQNFFTFPNRSESLSSGSGESDQDEKILQPIITLTKHPPLSCSNISIFLSKCIDKYGRISSCIRKVPVLIVKKGYESVDLLPNSTASMMVGDIVNILKEPACFDNLGTILSALGIYIPCYDYPPRGVPFSITFSGFGRGQVQLSVLTETVTVTVDCSEGQVALGLECRPTLCPEGYVKNGGQCSFVINTSKNGIVASSCLSDLVTLDHSNYTKLTNNTVLYNDQIHTVINYTSNDEPIVCTSNLIDCPTELVVVNTTEYKRLSNDTVLFKGETYDVVLFDDFEKAFICPPNETSILQNSTVPFYPVGYFILTYIGCSLSVVGCVLVLLTYGLFKSLRTFSSLILMNLVVAILAESLLIIIGGPITEAFPSIEICTIAAVFLHFFFLAQFTWMSLMSFQMARTFYLAKKLIANSDHNYKFAFILYFFIGWGVPLFITLVSIIVDFTTESLVSYGVQSDGILGSCWINHAESAIVLFIVPLTLTMIINFILFIVVTIFLCYAARSSKKIEKKRNFQFFRINIAMFSVTGLAWIFGFIALMLGTSWAWYPFILFTSSQGLTIFVAFLFTRHVLDLYRKLFLPPTSRPSY